MRSTILKVIHQIEKEYDVKVLFACESGSRAWGFPSVNSDFDVRFIYIHKRDWYLSIDRKRDVLEIPTHDSLSIPVHESIDMNGWEFTKTLRLFRKSNPTLLEWLNSSIVYFEPYSSINKLRDLSIEIFSATAIVHHYLKMAKGNYRLYLKDKTINIKKVLNVLRPLFAANWIEKYDTFPPIEFQDLLSEMNLPVCIDSKIQELLQRKKTGQKLDERLQVAEMNHFIEETIEYLETSAKNLNSSFADPTEILDQLFREALSEAWR